VWERIRIVLRIENLGQLADLIDISQPTISRRKNEDIFPIEWAYLISKKMNVDLDWILEGNKQKSQNEARKENYKLEFLRDLEKWLIEESEKDSDLIPWFRKEIREKFPKFAEWKRKAENEQKNNSVQIQKVI
jgi:hypothetical protein